MTPVRAWFARALGTSRATQPTDQTGSSRTRRSRSSRAQLQLEALEDRNLLSGGTGLTAQYYSGDNFNQFKLTRTDAAVNFNWGGQAPAAGLTGTNFSVRWTGYVQPLYSQEYTFYTRSDDGIRLWVNGVKLIDNWYGHSVMEDSASIRLVAGQKYQIKLEYFQGVGSSTAQLMWSSASQAKQVIPTGQLFTNSTTPTTDPAPTAKLTAATVTTAGATSYQFTVTYTDNTGVNVASLKTGNVRVTGPNGFNQVATLVRVDQTTNGTPRTATYQITPPGGKWDQPDNGTYTVILQSNQVSDIRGNYAAGGVLGTFQVSAPGIDWFDTNLRDAGVRNTARSLASDRNLTRNEMLTLFRAVQSNGVSTNEFTDLQTLVGNTSYISMPEYVRDLSRKVVYGDPANMQYQGRALGNLRAGSSGAQLEMLVGKWFLGKDHPAAATTTTYVMAQGTLFGSTGPTYTDIKQGNVSDCYFLAGLGEIAFRAPQTIRSMFIDNGDGTYTVRFLRNGTPTYVTVDRYLPVTSGGTFAYANYQASASNPANKLWVALAEKAYAQLAESGWSRPTSTVNAYNSLALGWEGDVIRQITGKSVTYQSIVNSPATGAAILDAFRSGKMIGMATKPATTADVTPGHVYIPVGFDTTTGLASLYNPWGKIQQMNWATIVANFAGWSVNVT